MHGQHLVSTLYTDNSLQESFFATLKTELQLDRARLPRAQTRTEVFEWIEVFYNRQRRHSSLGYQSPVAFEEQAPHPQLTLHLPLAISSV